MKIQYALVLLISLFMENCVGNSSGEGNTASLKIVPFTPELKAQQEQMLNAFDKKILKTYPVTILVNAPLSKDSTAHLPDVFKVLLEYKGNGGCMDTEVLPVGTLRKIGNNQEYNLFPALIIPPSFDKSKITLLLKPQIDGFWRSAVLRKLFVQPPVNPDNYLKELPESSAEIFVLESKTDAHISIELPGQKKYQVFKDPEELRKKMDELACASSGKFKALVLFGLNPEKTQKTTATAIPGNSQKKIPDPVRQPIELKGKKKPENPAEVINTTIIDGEGNPEVKERLRLLKNNLKIMVSGGDILITNRAYEAALAMFESETFVDVFSLDKSGSKRFRIKNFLIRNKLMRQPIAIEQIRVSGKTSGQTFDQMRVIE